MADENHFGELTVGEMRSLQSTQGVIDNLVREVGLLEVRKAHAIDAIREMETKTQEILAAAAVRLGIPAGEVWHVSPDGKVSRGDGQA